jgi:hypothetical protein
MFQGRREAFLFADLLELAKFLQVKSLSRIVHVDTCFLRYLTSSLKPLPNVFVLSVPYSHRASTKDQVQVPIKALAKVPAFEI